MSKDMEEFDLKNIWKMSNDQAKVYYQSIEPEVLEISRKKSNDLLQEIKRNAINETITGVILMFAIFYFMRNHPYVWILYSCTVILVITSYFSTKKFIHEIKSISTRNVVESIGSYHKVLSKALKKLKFLVWIFVPISFILGLLASFTDNGNDLEILTRWDGILLTIGISVPILFGMLWFVSKKYIFYMYESQIIELKKIYDDLKNQEKIL
ncbi:MAG: hypothetical protein AB8H03_25045 [Saprospiraceae bacterium]